MTDMFAGDGGHPGPVEPGHTWVFSDNIDTDQIMPSRSIASSDPDELTTYAFEDLRPRLSESVEPDDFAVASEDFGSGPSREHSPLSLVGAGVSAVVTQSFARIFSRNAINLGLPVLTRPGADVIEDDDEIHVDPDTGIMTSHTQDETYETEVLSGFLQPSVEQGGLKAYMKVKLDGRTDTRLTLYDFRAPEALDTSNDRSPLVRVPVE